MSDIKRVYEFAKSNGVLGLYSKISERCESAFSERDVRERILLGEKHVRNKLAEKNSVLVWTTHKCASTFISQLLRELDSRNILDHVDYAGVISGMGNKIDLENPYAIERLEHLYRPWSGEIYAPLRTPFKISNQKDFINIFFLRDPRDVLVSEYYSFGFSHAVPKHNKASERFLKRRKKIVAQSIDEYCLEVLKSSVLPKYEAYADMYRNLPHSCFLSYDYFKDDTVGFMQDFFSACNAGLDDRDLLEKLAQSASPVQKNSDGRKFEHKRSGASRQFEKELSAGTVNVLNETLESVLSEFGFTV